MLPIVDYFIIYIYASFILVSNHVQAGQLNHVQTGQLN